jgi:hypothetical protein
MLVRNFKDLRYEAFEFFFGKRLDEAYKQGITIGAEYAARKMSFEVHLKRRANPNQDRAARLRPRNRGG